MKKSLILVGMLVVGYANAQYDGKVGINTNVPDATMDVKPSSANSLTSAKTNEGILAPRLSKTRIANITTPIEGTLVYATDENTNPISAYTGTNTKVAKITEKGYYFYNGAEWVKAGGDAKNIYNADGSINEQRVVEVKDRLIFDFTGSNTDRRMIILEGENASLVAASGDVTGHTVTALSLLEAGRLETGYAKIGNLAGGSTKRNVMADNDGNLIIGNADVKATETTETCSDTNLGAIHFKEVEISGTSPVQKKGVFGFCTKQNGTAMWVYLSNGGNIQQGTGAFGEGL